MKKILAMVVLVCAAPLVMAQQAAENQEKKQLSKQALAKIAAAVNRVTARERALQAEEAVPVHGEKIDVAYEKGKELETFLEAQNLIKNVPQNQTAAILVALNPLRNLYEQKRLENPALVKDMAKVLAQVPFITKDKKEVRVESFIQMHINEVVADEHVHAELVSRLNWDREGVNAAVEAQLLMDNMLTWKDHIREDNLQ